MPRRDMSGPNNPRWKGGRWMHSKGYWMVWAPGHPACNCRNYAPEHRKNFYDAFGYLPPDGFDIHHKNGRKIDNTPDNLVELSNVEHGAENGPGGDHRRKWLRGMERYRLLRGMDAAKTRGAKGGRATARKNRRAKKQQDRAQRARARAVKRAQRTGSRLDV